MPLPLLRRTKQKNVNLKSLFPTCLLLLSTLEAYFLPAFAIEVTTSLYGHDKYHKRVDESRPFAVWQNGTRMHVPLRCKVTLDCSGNHAKHSQNS